MDPTTHVSIKSLPPELLRRVSNYIGEKPDLKNFRLVNRICGEIGGEDLFKFLYITPLPESVSRFQRFCFTQRHLTRLVKKVVMLLGNWEKIIWQPFLKTLQDSNILLNHGQQDEALTIFKKALHAYFIYLGSAGFARMLGEGFRSLRKLRTIVIEREIIEGDDPDDADDVANDGPKDDGGYAFWRRAQSYGLDVEDLEISIPLAWAHSDGYKTFLALIQAAYFSRSTIHVWRVEPEVKMSTSVFANKNLWKYAAVVFRECRELRLDIFAGREPLTSIWEKMTNGEIGMALECAVDLKRLEIFSDIRVPLPIHLIFGFNHVWGHLQEVEICSARFHPDEFQDLLQRHRAQLRVFRIRVCKLLSGSWLGPEGLIHWLNDQYLPHAKFRVFRLGWLYQPNGSYAGKITRGSL